MTTCDLTLKIESRTDSGSGSSKRLRREGKIPTVVYGHNKEPKHYSVEEKEWRSVVKKGDAHIIKVVIDNAKTTVTALIKEVQYDFLNGRTLHIDLQEVNMNEKITASVAIHPVGKAIGLKVGGVLDQVIHEIEVICLPNDLPESIEVDVSELELNDALHIKEIVFPENVKTHEDPDQVVFHVVEPKVKQEAAVEETAEGEGKAEEAAE